MSDNIPFEIQLEIIKKVSSVKSLIQFRSVSKPWKLFIDSHEFIHGYGARHTQSHSHIISYKLCPLWDAPKYICLAGDDIQTFNKVSAPFILSPLLDQYRVIRVVGVCHGLLCLYGFHNRYKKWMVVIWNHSIGKSFGISVVPPEGSDFGFGVCPVTRDPTLVKVVYADNKPWHVEFFTLNSGVWSELPSSNLPRQSVRLNKSSQVVIDRFIYWGAWEEAFTDNGKCIVNVMVVSFDMITKVFKVVELPDSLTNKAVTLSKLRESLVVYGYIEKEICDVWVMDRDSYFTKLFSICAPINKMWGFTKGGELIREALSEVRKYTSLDCVSKVYMFNTLEIYDPCSQHIRNLGISGVGGSFSMSSYEESLLLLDHTDLHIYSDDSDQIDEGHYLKCGFTKFKLPKEGGAIL